MNYQTQNIQIELHSPLLLGTDREYAIFQETRDYIPGSVLRGSLARLLQDATTAQSLETLFNPTTTQPIFEHLYAVSGGEREYTHPLPLSARTCKHNGGFKEQSKNHGIGDILIRQTVYEQALLNRAKLPYLYEPVCPECKVDVDRPSLTYYETTNSTYRSVSVPVRRLARTAINRRRYTAADQLLYTLETIEPGQMKGVDPNKLRFRGAIHYISPHQSILENYLPQVQWLGRGRSRGLGQITLEFLQTAPEQPSLTERIDKFNQEIWSEWHFYGRTAEAPLPPADTLLFSLDLLSPAVFTRYGLPTAQPDLSDFGFKPEQKVTIYRAFTDQHMIGGWHLGAKLPRRTMLAVSAGSVYVIGVQGLSLSELVDLLEPIETTGLGHERERGLGRVFISSPFHYQPEVTL
ncbi:CRISPR-associated RAMP protein Csx10 [Chloroflexota bacterium]